MPASTVLLIALGIGSAGPLYEPGETWEFSISPYTTIVQSLIDSDKPDNRQTPFEDESVSHFNLGIGVDWKFFKLINLGAELGMKPRKFALVGDPQPDGIGSEGYLKIKFAVSYTRK